MTHRKRSTCRVCGSDDMHCFLEMGPMALANSFLSSTDEFEDELAFPLDVYFCQNCSLVQLLDVIDPEVLFRHYLYVTGTSDTIAAHNKRYARTIVDLQKMGPDDLVVEIASNDGSLLRCFQELGVRTLGVDPAQNVAEIARSRGVETVAEFFDRNTAVTLRQQYGQAKAVIGNNVLAHVDDTVDFLTGFKELLTDDGLIVIEMPYLGNLIAGREYDTIYHEHLCYFSVNSLLRLGDEVGVSLVRIDRVPIHGGSLRMYAGLPEHYGGHDTAVLAMAEQERQQGMTSLSRFQALAEEVKQSRQELLDLIDNLISQGKTIAGYGASAKGTVLQNYCQITTDRVPYTVDKSPLKVGLYTPGMHIPVLNVKEILERQPDYILILAWNFADEIIRQQAEYQARGGKFIIPIPELKVV